MIQISDYENIIPIPASGYFNIRTGTEQKFQIRLLAKANLMSPTSDVVLVFRKIFLRCVSTVRSLMKSFAAICLLENSFAISLKMSFSRSVSNEFPSEG